MNRFRSPFPIAVAIFLFGVLSFLARPVPAVYAVDYNLNAACPGGVGNIADLIQAINDANGDSEPANIFLSPGCVYTFSQEDNYWYGPNALPAIVGDITIQGNGAVFTRDGSAVRLRFFYVAGAPTHLPTGSLTLRNLTLHNGLAVGGGGGGGGAGMGGAIFNQGNLTLDGATLSSNEAQGGAGRTFTAVSGGGLGANGLTTGGGGFGDLVSPPGSSGGAGGAAFGGGGGGFGLSADGADGAAGGAGGGPANGMGGAGGDSGGPGGFGSGGGGLGVSDSGAGGDFGLGGEAGGGNGAGGGGVGAGGGGSSDGAAGGGGFGGGGGSAAYGGDGGFGAGGGRGSVEPGLGGFGGGAGSASAGGGGAGLGGAIFNHEGSVTLNNSTLSGNSALGGPGAGAGSGFGGAIFNLNGVIVVNYSTISSNVVAVGATGSGGQAAGGAIYNLAYDSGTAVTALAILNNSILANSVGGVDLVNAQPTDTAAGSNLGTATAVATAPNIVESSAGTIAGSPISGDPMLGSLAYNGGLGMFTHALLPGSPAHNAANDVACPLTDQRGIARPQGAACDLGAYEFEEADIGIEKEAPAQVLTGADFVYTLQATNYGALTATNVVVTDTLPMGVTFVAAAGGDWVCAEDGGEVVCTLNTLSVGPAAPILIDVTAPLTAGLIVNTAVISSDVIDTNTANNSDEVTTNVVEPIADLAAFNSSPTTLGDTTYFTATISSGSNVTFAWNFDDGFGAAGANASHAYGAAGVYTAVVTATNEAGSFTATTAVTITNEAPIADAGLDQTVEVLDPVTLDGSGSFDPDGHLPLTYGWTQTGGTAVSLSDSGAVMPTFTAPPAPTVITFSLVVTDSFGLASAPDEVTITVNDVPITGLEPFNDSPTTLGQTTNFSATVASGSNVTYAWDFGDDMGTASGDTTDYLYGAAGVYTAVVTATNQMGFMVASTVVTITNEMPVADAGPDQTVEVLDPVTLDGSGSFDPDNHLPLTYGWTQTGGTAVSLSDPTAAMPTFTAPASPAVLTFSLVVTDSFGLASLPDSVTITVEDTPITGLEAFNSSPTTLGDTTYFTATITGGSNVQFTWNFGDNLGMGGGANDSYVYPAAGVYTAVVTATNEAGSVTATTLVTITNEAPIADAGPDQTVQVATLVTLDGSGSFDPDNHLPLTYGWTQTGGPTVALSGSGVVSPTFAAPAAPTVITFTLVVTDSFGLASLPSEVAITVVDDLIDGLTAVNDSPTTLGQTTNFTATITNGSNVTYAWNFGDGILGAGQFASHVYSMAGLYTAVVTATNEAGSVTATTAVTITNEIPVADAGLDQTVFVTDPVTLDGSGSSDPDGHLPLTYGWMQTGGPAVTLSDMGAPMPTFTAPTSPAVLTFTLVVTDSFGLPSLPDSVTITAVDAPIMGLTAVNDSPTSLDLTTNFTATISGGSNVTFSWYFGDMLGVDSGANVSYVYGATGVYTAVVTATNSVSSVTAQTIVTIANDPPVADAGADQTVEINDSVQLDGSSSSDPDNHLPLTYGWTQTGGPAVALSDSGAISPTFTAPGAPTVITFTLVVTDSYGLPSLPDEVVITVIDEPVVGLTADNDSPTTLGDTTNFTATISSGTGVTYAWDFGDDNFGAGQYPSHVYGAVGTYTAVVTATNTAGSWTATTLVTITDVPITGLTADNDSPTVAGDTTNFTATVASGSNVVYTWTFGDGNGATGQFPSHTYGSFGTFAAVVTATNGTNSLTATTMVTITNEAPVADAGLDETVFVMEMVALDGSGSFDPDGHALTYGWAQTGGPVVSLSDPAAIMPTFTAPAAPTVLTFTLVVTDSFGLPSLPDEVVITVVDEAIAGLEAFNDSPTILTDPTAFTATLAAGTNVVFTWNFDDGNFGAGQFPVHSYGADGVYTAVVTATNSVNTLVATTTVTIVLNMPPTADAGLDQTVFVENMVTLDGSGSSDPEGQPLLYDWRQTGGTAVTLSDPAAIMPTFTAPSLPAVLTFSLTVTDTYGAADSDSVTITVTDRAIVDLAAFSSAPTLLGDTTFFTATISGGSNVAYAWDFGDGNGGVGANVTHDYAAVGVYTATVTATNSVDIVTASVSVLVYELGLRIEKEASVASANVGDTVIYTYTIYNEGSLPLTDLHANDDPLGPVALPTVTLDPGQMMTATLTYVIDESDLPGPLVNTVVVTGTTSLGNELTDSAMASVDLTSSSDIAVSVTASVAEAKPGDLITYNYVVTNLGDVTLNGVTAVDSRFGSLTLSQTNIPPGGTAVAEYLYTVQSADLPGPLVNEVAATGTPTAGTPISASDSVTVTLGMHILYLPVIVNNFVIAPDLVVTSLTATANGVELVIENQGNWVTESAFWVDFYVAPNPPPVSANEVWNDGRSDYGLAWGVTAQLAPGESLTLVYSNLPGAPNQYLSAEFSLFPATLAAGTAVYAQVDSARIDSAYGAILEIHEILGLPYNNIIGPVMSQSGVR